MRGVFLTATAVAALFVGAEVLADDIVIDDFTSGEAFSVDLGQTDRILGVIESGLDPDHTIGRVRQFAFDSCIRQGDHMPVSLDITTGIFSFGGTEDSRFCEGPGFGYGRYSDNRGPLLNLDLASSGTTALVIDLLSFDAGTSASSGSVWIMLQTISPSANGSVFATEAFVSSDLPQSVVIPFTSFSESSFETDSQFSWSDVDRIFIEFRDITKGGELSINRFAFTAVPEPASAALLTVGAFSLSRRRA